MYRKKITNIEMKIKDLVQLRNVLSELAIACSGSGSLDNCPILAALDEPSKDYA